MKILYFTATGNSLHIAKEIAEAEGGELLAIPQMIKEGTYEFTDEKIGFIFPLHAWGVPSYLVEFLKKAKFNTNYLFAITTFGVYSGAVAMHLTNTANEAGFSFDYINAIKMVDNYVATFDVNKEVENEHKKNIDENLAIIKSDIAASKEWILKENFLQKAAFNQMAKRAGKPFNKKRLKVQVYGEGLENYLRVEDSCTQCGVCASVCPVNNIAMDNENGKIKLSDDCFMCMACLHHCPSNAIHISGEVSRNRYLNSNIKLAEIVKSNNQADKMVNTKAS